MSYQNLTLTGGANVVETPALNEAGVSVSQLVRFKPDPKGHILVEKLGGWAKFYATQVTSVIRAIAGWEDTNANTWFAFGTSSAVASQLTVVQCVTSGSGVTTASGPSFTVTPTLISDITRIVFFTTVGSSTVRVSDNIVTGLSTGDSVFITTPINAGGIILFGQYNITAFNTYSYYISATNVLGAPVFATYANYPTLLVTAGTFAAGTSSTIIFTYALRNEIPYLVGESVAISGVNPSTWNGPCIVLACTTTQVTVIAPAAASGIYNSGGSISNNGSAPVLTTTAGSYVVTVTFPDHGQTVGSSFAILNQVFVGGLSFFGNYVVRQVINNYTFTINALNNATSTASAVLGGYQVVGAVRSAGIATLTVSPIMRYLPTITTANSYTSNGITVTISWPATTPYTFNIGQSIIVVDSVPPFLNNTYNVTSSTLTSVTFSLAIAVGSGSFSGTISPAIFIIGSDIIVSGVTPAAFNGVFTVTNATANSVSYILAGSGNGTAGGMVSDISGDATAIYNITSYPLSSSTGIFPAALTWYLDNWGEVLVALPVGVTAIQYNGVAIPYSPLFVFDPTIDKPQSAPLNAGPSVSSGFFVAMPQRQIVAWGTSFNGIIDPLLIRWCDVSNYNVWIGQTTNQAGSYRLSTGSAIVGALQAVQKGLIWTNLSLWTMQYIGLPYVYSFDEVARGCGLIARKAAGVMNNDVYWMGSRQFFMYSSNGVQTLTCPVWDAVYQNLDQANLSKITIAVNSLFQEISWYYPVFGGNGECSAYVRYSVLTGLWDFGNMGRTAWMDNSVLGPPIGYDPVNQYVYQHEISPDADGVAIAASFTTGWFAISEGQNKTFLDEVWPDFKWGYYNQSQASTVQITFNAADFPGQTPTTYGPYSVTKATQWFNTRIRARLLSVTISSNDVGSFWRMGNLRYRIAADGRY